MADPARSRWWYFLPIYVASLLVSVFGGSDTFGGALAPLAEVAVIVLLLGELPLAICLFMDSRAIRHGEFDWTPNQYLYAALALSGLLATTDTSLSISEFTVFDITVGGRIPFQPIIILIPSVACLFYLYRRYRYVGFR